MDNRKRTRIRHYCKLLRLPTWDTNDLLQYFTLYFNDQYSVDFMAIRSNIIKLDLANVADRLAEYIEMEEQKFKSYQMTYPGIPDDRIWQRIYREMDNMINLEISDAKQSAKVSAMNKGCYIIIIFIILILIYLFSR